MVAMKRAGVLGSLSVLLPLLVSLVPVAPACAGPPCGPIPVIIDIQLDKWKGLTFGEADTVKFEGTVSFYINVDQDGFWFDPQQDPLLRFRVNRQPPWVETKVEPESYVVPLKDLKRVGPEGAPTEVQYLWQDKVTITVTRVRDPTPEELAPDSPYVRRDGTFRITTSGTSTSSVLAPELLGPNMGLQEGYGVRELRFIPEIGGVQWIPDEQGVLRPSDGIVPLAPEGNAPAPWAAATILGLIAVIAARPRRQT